MEDDLKVQWKELNFNQFQLGWQQVQGPPLLRRRTDDDDGDEFAAADSGSNLGCCSFSLWLNFQRVLWEQLLRIL